MKEDLTMIENKLSSGKDYSSPKASIVSFDTWDVITASGDQKEVAADWTTTNFSQYVDGGL